jgi:UDP-N-acetylmuramate dehydrogenase
MGGTARWLVRPRSVEELCEIVRRAADEGIPVRPIGRGANLLVNDHGVDGIVLRLDHPGVSGRRYENNRLIADGGADMMRVVVDTARRGLAGLECMAGIPGSIGGCLRGHAGGRYGAISQCVTRVTCLDYHGRVHVRELDALEFRYRWSNLRDVIIIGAEFELEPVEPAVLRERLREIWQYKKDTQPLAERSTGCIFKNPPDGSAGALIERAGLKGLRCGGAQVSERHANFIVAREGARAVDVQTLIDRVRTGVAREFDVDLELEIEVW